MSASRTAAAVFAVLMMTVGLPSTLGAQDRPASGPPACTGTCVAIRSTGGFLGYLDGFPEFPGWLGDTFAGNTDLLPNRAPRDPKQPVPYGGLLGVATYLKSHALSGGVQSGDARTLLLMSGNNHPLQIAALRNPALRNADHAIPPAAAHWFWKPMIDIKPQAVGVGTEDMHRWLEQMRPEHLVTWVNDAIGAELPFVASNVIVRLIDPHLNVVQNDAHHVRLDVAAGESLDMLDALTVIHPCAVAGALRSSHFAFDSGPVVTVKALAAAEARAERESTANKARRAVLGDTCRTTLEFQQRLRPGRSYLLQSSLFDSKFRFRLTTHQVLTPHPAWDGLPVVRAAPAGVPMAIMSFLSPSTREELPPAYFAWEKAEGCPVANCRMEFVSADKAARSLLDAITPAAGQPAPVLVVMSDLDEAENTALLEAVPEIRFLALPPDSARLGRAALAVPAPGRQDRRYSGDLNFGAVVDAQHPELTRVMVRPTWLGETVHTAFADFAPPAPGGSWLATNVSVWFEPVPGASLGGESSANGLRYNAFFDPLRFRNSPAPVPADPAVFQPYCPIDANGPFDGSSGERQGDLWTNPGSFAGLVLDDMRRLLRADIAIAPESWIDRDVIATLEAPPATGRPALSGFVLQRILYRSKRVVRVSIEGSRLRDTLKAIITEAAAGDDAVCVSGLGLVGSCPLVTIDADELLVNVRKPEDGNYYRVALPASVARAKALAFDDRATRDLLASLDSRLAACQPASSQRLRPAEDPVAERLENRLAARWQHYLKLDPLTVEYASTAVNEVGPRGVFSRLPVDGSGEQPSRKIAVEADVNGVLLDTTRVAVRIPAELRYRQTRVDQETSYDEDEFAVGFRVDGKRLPVRWARLFAGVFFDGRLFDQVESVGSVRRLGSIPDPRFPGLTLDNATTPGPTVPFTTAPQRYLAGAYGLEVREQSFGPMTVTGFQVSQSYGRVYNVPIGVRLGDQPIDLEAFLKGQASATLSAYYQQYLEAITEQTPFGYVTATRGQSRIQVDAKTATTLPLSVPLTIATEHRYRWYRHDQQEAGLFTERSFETKLALEMGIAKRWTVGPYAEWTDVIAGIKRGRDQRFSVFRWGGQVKIPLFWNGRSIE